MENKKDIVMRLTLLLKITRAGSGIKKLVLSGDQKTVTIEFYSGGGQGMSMWTATPGSRWCRM